jgi:hypothetical protein
MKGYGVAGVVFVISVVILAIVVFATDLKCKWFRFCSYVQMCERVYKPGITYLTSCETYTKYADLSKEDKCNMCKKYLGYSGYNKACQYFSGPFVDESDDCYGKAMDECKTWEPSDNCCDQGC